MADNYYMVRFMVAGYEVAIIMSGTEKDVVQTVQQSIGGPISLRQLSRSTALSLQRDLGMKVYACISDDVEETVITQVVDPVEDSQDFQTSE